MNENSACPIWGTPAAVSLSHDANDIQCDEGSTEYQDVDSPRAGGRYRIRKDASVLLHEVSLKARLTSWLIEQQQLGEKCPEITAKTIENVERRRWLPIRERADRLLRYFGKEESNPGQELRLLFYTVDEGLYGEEVGHRKYTDSYFNLLAWIESAADQPQGQGSEIKFFCDYLSMQGWITDVNFQTYLLSLRLTVEGHAHLEALEHTVTASSRAFVAMWFDDSMSDAWEGGIGPAIKDAGYEAIRIDRKEHANKIDDEIIAEIRRSRFVVADFTHGDGGARGGVYYEAGFAHGLDIPVIFTCRQDVLEKVHFDTRQYNHIVWQEPGELRHRLATRIAAVIGDGPLKDSGVR